MTETAMVVSQSAWNCRWSRPGMRLTGWPLAQQPESEWVCVHEGVRRDLSHEECATCLHWENFDDRPSVAGAVASSRTFTVDDLLRAGLRTTMVTLAFMFIAIGLTILTSPAAIPITVSFFLCAAACVGWVAFGRLPGEASSASRPFPQQP